MVVNATINGIAFSAIDVESDKRTIGEVSIGKEEIISSQLQKAIGEKQQVVFNDPINSKIVKTDLSMEVIDRLKSHFDSEDFIESSGYIELVGDAESFVSGWYGDIAYNREFLKADRNEDGKLNQSEYKNTLNEFKANGKAFGIGNSLIVNISLRENYVKVGENSSQIVNYNRDDYTKPTSIEEELEETIRVDSDYSGNMTLRESFNKNESNRGLNNEQIAENQIKEAVAKGIISDSILQFLSELEERVEKMRDKENSLIKEIAQFWSSGKPLNVDLGVQIEEIAVNSINDSLKKLDKINLLDLTA